MSDELVVLKDGLVLGGHKVLKWQRTATVQHRLDKAREDAPAVWEQTCTTSRETRRLRYGVWF
jgi:hypothetical protein